MKYILKNNSQVLQNNNDQNNCSYIPKHNTRIIAVPGMRGPENIVESAYLYVSNHKPIIIESSHIIPLDVTKFQKNIEFQNNTVTLIQTGKYLLNWNITAMNTSNVAQEIQIALFENSDMSTPALISKSGEDIAANGYAMLSGNAILDIQPLKSYYFVNNSDQEITIDTLSAMISVKKID